MAHCKTEGCPFYAQSLGYCSVCFRRAHDQIQDSDPALPPGWVVIAEEGDDRDDDVECFAFPRCVVVLKKDMFVHLPGSSTTYSCQGDHYHASPVVCMGGRVICKNYDGCLSSVELDSGHVQRSPDLFQGGWPEDVEFQVDPSSRFLVIGTKLVDPLTLEITDKTTDLPILSCELPLPDRAADTDLASLPGLAAHTSCGATRLWRRQVFHASVGDIVASVDDKTKLYKIHWNQSFLALCLHADLLESGDVHVSVTTVAGHTVLDLQGKPTDELPQDFWNEVAQRSTPGAVLRLILPDKKVVTRDGFIRRLQNGSLTFIMLADPHSMGGTV